MKILWNSYMLYDKPETGVCQVSGAYETGRWYVTDENERIFVGNTAAPDAVEDYVGFLTVLGTVEEFKRGYSRRDRKAASLPAKKKKK